MTETEPDPIKVLREAVRSDGAHAGRVAARKQNRRGLVWFAVIGFGVVLLISLIGNAYTYHLARDASTSTARNAAKNQARDAAQKTTKDQVAALKSQVDAINAKRASNGLPPIKKVAQDVTNTAPGSTQDKQNTQLVAQLAAALIPTPKDGKPGKAGKDGKTGPAGVSVTSIGIVRCTLTLATSDGKSYAGHVCGAPGKNGAAGTQGVQGIPGKDGASAYAVWLAAGNSGSVADFLASLKGTPGRGVAAIGTTGKVNGCQRFTVQYSDPDGTVTAPAPIGDPVCDGAQGLPGADGKDSTVPGPKGDKGDPAPVVQSYTETNEDGSVKTCKRTAGTDTDPEYSCSITTPPPGGIITPP